MVLESTVICVDNSEFMRNGDFIPNRMQAQQDAVDLICHSKTSSNAENNVGLITLAKAEVLVTLTSNVGRLMSKLHEVEVNGIADFITGIKIAQLALRNRQGKNHKMRIIVFIGSPLNVNEDDLVKLAKRLRKEKVNVDIVNFGENEVNSGKLSAFISAINGRDGTGSHLFSVPHGSNLHDALISSALLHGEDGAVPNFEFGVDPSEDPELALALRISIEEQRMRLEDQAQRDATGGSEQEQQEQQQQQSQQQQSQQQQPSQQSQQPDQSNNKDGTS